MASSSPFLVRECTKPPSDVACNSATHCCSQCHDQVAESNNYDVSHGDYRSYLCLGGRCKDMHLLRSLITRASQYNLVLKTFPGGFRINWRLAWYHQERLALQVFPVNIALKKLRISRKHNSGTSKGCRDCDVHPTGLCNTSRVLQEGCLAAKEKAVFEVCQKSACHQLHSNIAAGDLLYQRFNSCCVLVSVIAIEDRCRCAH